MPIQTIMTAQLACTMGAAPSVLQVIPARTVLCSKLPAANIGDFAPMVNIASFGVCISPANPAVAAATAAALGVLTPMPCIPNTTGPWTPGAPTILLDGMPALDNASVCMCAYAGVISIVSPGQVQTTLA